MNAFAARLVARVVAGVVAVLVIVAGVQYVCELRAELAGAKDTARRAKDDLAGRDETIRHLQDDAAEKANQQRKLDADRNSIDAKLAGIRDEIRRYNNESAEFRAWAAGALPADIVRMHTSPALTGAAGYLARVPGGDALHAAGNGPDH
ncbi:Rz-like lysis system protein LysB [Paraburkholderia sediminicola]|uniref:Rz-like lysis system protein LysB n=1 Tax=Paraburkholderia sediminicola TaxID=458836 RepID=UPI0038BAD75C